MCVVVPVAGQRTHETTFRALKVISRVATQGGVCGLWLLVRFRDGVRGWRSVRVGLLSTKLAFLGRVYSQVRVRVTLVSGARELSSMMIFQRQMFGRGKVFGGGGKCPTFASPTHVEPRTGSRRTQRTSAVHYGVISDAPKSLSK